MMEGRAWCLTYPRPLGAASQTLGRPPMSWREWCLWLKKNEGVRAGMKRRKWTPFSEGEEEAGNTAEWEAKSSRGLLEGWQMRGETMGWRGGDWEDLGGWASTGQRLSRRTRKLAKGAGLGGLEWIRCFSVLHVPNRQVARRIFCPLHTYFLSAPGDVYILCIEKEKSPSCSSLLWHIPSWRQKGGKLTSDRETREIPCLSSSGKKDVITENQPWPYVRARKPAIEQSRNSSGWLLRKIKVLVVWILLSVW